MFTAGPIDPRDISWEQDVAVYRVYFEDRTGATDEWRITGAANVSEVLTWAELQALGRMATIYVEVDVVNDYRGMIQVKKLWPERGRRLPQLRA